MRRALGTVKGELGFLRNPDAGGRSRTLLYTCWNDGAGNYVDPNAKWWSCWRCGSTYTF